MSIEEIIMQQWTQAEVKAAIEKALENEPEGPSRDYWLTDCMVAEIRKKFGLKRLKPDPVTIVLVRPVLREGVHPPVEEEGGGEVAQGPPVMKPECRLKTLVMPFGKFAGLTFPWSMSGNHRIWLGSTNASRGATRSRRRSGLWTASRHPNGIPAATEAAAFAEKAHSQPAGGGVADGEVLGTDRG